MQKIKGGRWTVTRFATVSVGYTIGWMLISSLLGWYKELYGPQVLLLMNIAYFLPSIPLLVASSLLDAWLEERAGLARTILARLLFGLGGSTVLCASFPFQPQSLRWLLGSVTLLGLLSSIAFSASYQMVAHFANKNTISLGLGCAGSGVLVLLLELLLGVGAKPSHMQLILLMEIGAGVLALGFAAVLSLLFRHWGAIEAHGAHAARQPLAHPLLQQAEQGEAHSAAAGRLLRRRTSISPLLGISPIEFLEPAAERELPSTDVFSLAALTGSLPELEQQQQLQQGLHHHRSARDLKQSVGQALGRSHSDKAEQRQWHTTPPSAFASAASAKPSAPVLQSLPEQGPAASQAAPVADALQPGTAAAASDLGREHVDEQHGGIVAVAAAVWPIMLCLFMCALACVTCFPFFTYVPSGGRFAASLPKVLFFTRLFADVAGRSTPRVKRLAVTSLYSLLGLSCLLVAGLPFFFVYIKLLHWHNDFLVTGFVVAMWYLAGYLNTCAYMTAPQCVPTAQKPMANALLALASQIAHCVGLAVAIALAFGLYGDIAA